jgi:hypothetical protein
LGLLSPQSRNSSCKVGRRFATDRSYCRSVEGQGDTKPSRLLIAEKFTLSHVSTTAFQWLKKIRTTPQSATGWSALAAICLPPILLGPWLPFIDLLAFVGLDTFPAKLSYGPLQFGVFQFTYVVHLAIARFLSGLGVSAGPQIVLMYLLEAAVFFVVLWRLLVRLIPESWLCCTTIALGTLACWDGLFLWGGPLPFSLAATSLAVATLLTVIETEEPSRHALWAVPALSWLSVMCHPFALPFAVLLNTLRFLFAPGRRLASAGTIVALGMLSWVIQHDTPATEIDFISGFTSFHAGQFGERAHELFTVDHEIAKRLFGFVPTGLSIYFLILSAVHIAGFVTSPFVAVLAKPSRQLRLLALLNICAVLMYFFTPTLKDVLPWAPQRVLSFYSPFTFVTGIAGPVFLLRRRGAFRVFSAQPHAWGRWLLPPAIIVAIVLVQLPILSLADNVLRNYTRARDAILQAGISDAFVVITDLEEVRPFYLRGVSFLLFSDPEIVKRNLILQTEWHIQSRHPTRLTEQWFDLGRARYRASFGSKSGNLSVRILPTDLGERPVAVGNNGVDLAVVEFNLATELRLSGALRSSFEHYQAALRIRPNFAQAQNDFGAALFKAGSIEQALAAFQAATRSNPKFVDAYCNAGITLLRLGRHAEAAECFQAALAINPSLSVARAGLQEATASISRPPDR